MSTTTSPPVVTHRRSGEVLRLVSAAFTVLVAFSAYAGVFGLVSGGISFGAEIDRRLPFESYQLAGLALLLCVALPMTLAAVALLRRSAYATDALEGAGVMLVAWIALQLAFIQTYSWYHPTYLAFAVIAIGLAVALRVGRRTGR